MKETIYLSKHVLALFLASSSLNSAAAVSPPEQVSQWHNALPTMGAPASLTSNIEITSPYTNAAKQANVTTSCTDCIRAGWVWCSNKWNYEAPIGTTWSDDFTANYLTKDEIG